MRFNITKLATAAALTLVTTFSAFAQTTYDRRPAQHNAEHKDLLAYQTNINEQIKLKETLDYMDNIFSEEEEPEEDDFDMDYEPDDDDFGYDDLSDDE